jgi:hypothetical protein
LKTTQTAPPILRFLPQVDFVPGKSLLSLAPGEILEGTILERRDSDQLRIRIKGQDFWARTQVPLPANGKISLQVEALGPQVLLRFLSAAEEGESGSLGPLKKILVNNLPLARLAESLTILAKTTPDSLPSEVRRGIQDLQAALAEYAPSFLTDPVTLREKVAQSGLFWENRLWGLVDQGQGDDSPRVGRQDLKGLISRLKSLLQGGFGPAEENDPAFAKAKDGLQTLDRYLQRIEAYQLLNQRYGDSAEKWLLLLPLWFGQELTFLELSGGSSRRQGASPPEEETTLLFLLNLPGEGKIRIEVAIRKEDLFCRIHSSTPSFREEIQRNLPELESRLRALGFFPSLSVFESRPGEEKETLMSQLGEEGENLLSLLI